ncbi:MAG: DUF5317 domain-containing protein [Actinomycetota bacterium]|nr:DUF5317 domain-containing protein [Actinomycetota bacterium]
MSFTAVAVVVGIAIGLLTGGRLDALGERTFRGVPLLVAGVVLQLAGGLLVGVGVAMVLLSYAALLAFCILNLHVVGMGVVLVGLAMNSLVIGVNGGMPVRRSAVVAAGIASYDDLPDIKLDGKRHFEDDDDRLMFLADIVPVPPLREVLSFGDLVMSVGVADVLVHLLRPAAARRRFAAESHTPGPDSAAKQG